MRAILCDAFGPPETLIWREAARVPLQPGQVRVRVHAAGLNFADILMVGGQYQVKPAFPFSPGLEAAGEVIETGPDVTNLMPGQRVLAISRFGGAHAEELVADARLTIPIPDAMDWATAAAFPVAYGTSYYALTTRGALQPGETLVVAGAAGGVGLTAVEIGRQLGARVIAIAGGPEKCAVARDHGAEKTIDHRTSAVRDRIRDLTGGRGADVIYDPVGGDLADACLRAVNWNGRILVIGFAAGRIQQVPANLLLLKGAAMVGVAWGGQAVRDPGLVAAQMRTLLDWWRDGRLRPRVSATFPLAQTAQAMQALLTRTFPGKIVLTR